MDRQLRLFESITRKAHRFTEADALESVPQHPFETRNVHQALPQVVQDLFDNGHYAQATFEAFKYIDKLIQTIAGTSKSGFANMMEVFGGTSPQISLTRNSSISERDEQKGYKFLFAGSMLGIRNPRGHEFSIKDSPDQCLDCLAFASMLLRRLEQSGYNVKLA